MTDGQLHPAEGLRFCNHCGARIPAHVMLRARWNARFCGDPICRSDDRKVIRQAKKAERVLRGVCVECGRKRRSAREQTQAEG